MLDVIESIRSTAEKNQAAAAVIGPSVYLTYGDLLDKVARISNLLADRRVPRRAKIYLNLNDANLRLVASLACLHYGVIPFIALDIRPFRDEVDFDFVIGSPNPFAADIPSDIVIDQTVLDGKLADPKLREFPDLAEDDIMFIGTTTGTTGRRKLVAHTYHRWLVRARMQPQVHAADRVEENDRVMFTIGDVVQYGFTLSCQILLAKAALVRKGPNMPETLKLIGKYSVNRLITTPAALERMMDHMEALRMRCPSLKHISITGSLFHRQLVERAEKYFDANLRVGYGSSEAGGVSTGTIKADTFKMGYVGELWPDVKVVSAGTAETPALIKIVNDPDRVNSYYSKGTVIKDTQPFYTLPDLGYLDGYSLYLVGRDDEVFNVSGNKFPFSMIEGVVRGIRGIKDVALANATPIGDPLGLVVAVESDSPVDQRAIIDAICQALRLRVAERHLRIVQVPEIPRNDMGKVDRRALLDAWVAERPPTVGGSMPEPVGHA